MKSILVKRIAKHSSGVRNVDSGTNSVVDVCKQFYKVMHSTSVILNLFSTLDI